MPRNKHRLYITLQHRLEEPGFHWALVLAPKAESSDVNNKDSHLFHATNAIADRGAGASHVTQTTMPPWRYEQKPANSLRSGTLLSRLLVAKFPNTDSIAEIAAQIDQIVKPPPEGTPGVPIVQGDRNWTCRIWVEQALDALRASGGAFAAIPQVTNGGTLERDIIAFGDQAKTDHFAGNLVIRRVTDLRFLDIRGR